MSRTTPRNTDAINNPVNPSGVEFASQMDIGELPDRLMKSTGEAKKSLQDNVIECSGDIPLQSEKMQMLAFMAEPVTVRIGTTTDKNAEQVFEINVNGNMHFFQRGAQKTVPRYIVDRLMRLKQTSYTQREVINNEGIREFLHVPQSALKYDFAIIRDDNPLGTSWQRAVLAEPA